MKIVAFLQNPGLPENSELLERYNIDHEFRKEILTGSFTGRRIIRCLGQDFFDSAWWDNATHRLGPVTEPDVLHIQDVVRERTPDTVCSFGLVAMKGVYQVHEREKSFTHVHFPHPNARGITDDDFRSIFRGHGLCTTKQA